MARSRRMSVQKRLRERKQAEKAELKRATQPRPIEAERPAGTPVSARAELESYGVVASFSGPRSPA